MTFNKGDMLPVAGGGYIRVINPDWPEGDEPFCERADPNTWALVYMRPDGWWEAGRGWETLHDARESGKQHDWLGTDWGIVNIPEEIPHIEGVGDEDLAFGEIYRREAS
jgi:hypothetical protein